MNKFVQMFIASQFDGDSGFYPYHDETDRLGRRPTLADVRKFVDGAICGKFDFVLSAEPGDLYYGKKATAASMISRYYSSPNYQARCLDAAAEYIIRCAEEE